MKRIVSLLLLLCMAASLCACGKAKVAPLREEDIRAICELATLECYYNNVAKIDKEAGFFLQKDRKMWIEYEGRAVIGIDMADVGIEIKGKQVNITLPEAEILNLDYVLTPDSYIISEDGWLFKNEITTEEQDMAVTGAQEEMRKAVQENKSLFLQAEARAKELIENYILKLGEATGMKYTIQWNR